MLWGALHWVVDLVEVIAVVVAILVVGLVIGTVGFWILSRILGSLEGPTTESDSDDYEMDQDVATKLIPSRPDGASPSSGTEHL
jgi:hypothetical protein